MRDFNATVSNIIGLVENTYVTVLKTPSAPEVTVSTTPVTPDATVDATPPSAEVIWSPMFCEATMATGARMTSCLICMIAEEAGFLDCIVDVTLSNDC